ncbi:asparagine synthetase B family protein [Aurantiacibacter poecillastricola]|uniref:asparagine synthetase B family protein n=1 Tax=Aurantiacibacter poecillastricola TaxID=3064385 RepID=UPI00273D760C|nr:asparagine synthase-related protein [Aurantiacibacter sp. 219JJ12-13]MDP5260724.1 asparagine synthase-related protein [Aurantiacibacter sp. 219JJ12-13]
MSGIAAILHTGGKPVEERCLHRMTEAISYRGPDGIDHWVSGNVALGHCAMHATAESSLASQPLANEDGTLVVVMDGYLSNWEELRTDLLQRGCRLRTRSDAELILRAYETWGENCPAHIDGEYAFVIWDARAQALYAARDHQGLRPLLYHYDGETLVIGSDMAAVLSALPHTLEVNHHYMVEVVLRQGGSADETAYVGIKRLLGASWMRVDGSGLRTGEYWQLPIGLDIRYRIDAEYVEHYREVYEESIRRASRTHRPLAIEVSGGLDSSANFCLAHKLLGEGRLHAGEIRGYTLEGPARSAADELAYVEAVERFTGRSIRRVPLFIPDLDWFARQAARDRDFATYPNGAMSLNLEKALVDDGCRVAMNGDGGDTWLGGTRSYREAVELGEFRLLAEGMRAEAAEFGWKVAVKNLLRSLAVPLTPEPLRRAFRNLRRGNTDDEDHIYYLLNREARVRHNRDFERWLAENDAPGGGVHKVHKLKLAFRQASADMLNRQHAQNGCEYRNPMLSRPFIEFCAQTPESTRLRGMTTKYTHREAMRGIMPEELVNRNSKAEFGVVSGAHKRKLLEFFENDVPEELWGAFDADRAKAIVKTYCTAAIDTGHAWPVWGLYSYAVLLGLQNQGPSESYGVR